MFKLNISVVRLCYGLITENARPTEVPNGKS